jgi:hypothetical protein
VITWNASGNQACLGTPFRPLTIVVWKWRFKDVANVHVHAASHVKNMADGAEFGGFRLRPDLSCDSLAPRRTVFAWCDTRSRIAEVPNQHTFHIGYYFHNVLYYTK